MAAACAICGQYRVRPWEVSAVSRRTNRKSSPAFAGEDEITLYYMQACAPSVGERIGAHLEMHRHGRHAHAAFLVPWRAVAARRPQAAALPAGIRIVDAAIEALGVEAGRVRHLHDDHLAAGERDQAVIEIAGRDRDVVAEPERVVLVDPGVIARTRRCYRRCRQNPVPDICRTTSLPDNDCRSRSGR